MSSHFLKFLMSNDVKSCQCQMTCHMGTALVATFVPISQGRVCAIRPMHMQVSTGSRLPVRVSGTVRTGLELKPVSARYHRSTVAVARKFNKWSHDVYKFDNLN